jgi:hypothetical protein
MPDPTKSKLYQVYQLSEALVAALEQLEENPELPIEDLERLLDGLTHDFNTKVEDIGLAIGNINARIAAKQTEIRRLQEAADYEDQQVARLKGSLMALMNRAGVPKVKGKLVTVSICANGGAIPITVDGDPKDLPEEFRKEVVTYSLNREAVTQAQAVGIDLPDVIHIQPRGQHIRIS